MKNKLIIALSLVCVALLIGTKAYHTKYVEQKERSKAFEQTISDFGQEIERTKIRLNDSIELYSATVRDLRMSKKNVEDKYGKLLRASNVKPKDVNAVTSIGTIARSIDTVPVLVDTFGGLHASVHDKWARVDVEVKPDRQAIIDYDFKDSLSVFAIQKKHSILFGLIKWKSLEGTKVISHNPKAQIVGLQTIDVIQ